MEQQILLFEQHLYKRKASSQIEFEQANHELLMGWISIVDSSFERYSTLILSKIEKESRDNKLAATAISGFLRGSVIRQFPNYCARATKSRFKMYNESAGDWIYIKKLSNRKKRPSNIKTANNELILNQQTTSEKDTGQNVFLGYTCNKDKTHITGIWAVCFEGKKDLWRIDIREYVRAYNEKTKKMERPKQETKLKDSVVKLKKAK